MDDFNLTMWFFICIEFIKLTVRDEGDDFQLMSFGKYSAFTLLFPVLFCS